MTDMCNAVAMRMGSARASLANPSKSAMGQKRRFELLPTTSGIP
jgi:hypothetical protein